MSLQGRLAIRGSTATLRRSTKSRNAGGASNLSWATIVAGIKVLLDEPDAELMARLFGEETRASVRGIVLDTVDVRPQDGLIISAGWKSGTNFTVVAVSETGQGMRSRHRELALVSTPETFA